MLKIFINLIILFFFSSMKLLCIVRDESSFDTVTYCCSAYLEDHDNAVIGLLAFSTSFSTLEGGAMIAF